ncbi:MAG: ankyrin repeat domain-containing protein [Deltaproteobacteria bacterium]
MRKGRESLGESLPHDDRSGGRTTVGIDASPDRVEHAANEDARERGLGCPRVRYRLRAVALCLAVVACKEDVCEPDARKPCLSCSSYAEGAQRESFGSARCEGGDAWGPCAPDVQAVELVEAARSGDDARVIAMLERGADPDVRIEGCVTPLLAAARLGHEAVVSALLDAHADPLAHTKVEVSKGRSGATPLFLASVGGHTKVVERLLAADVPVDRGTLYGETPLSGAVTGDIAIVRRLLAAGADVNAQDELTKQTPVGLAAAQGRAEVLALLLAREPEFAVRDTNGLTPLDLAAAFGHARAVELLLAAGAPVETEQADVESPLLHAAGTKELRVVRALVAAGADVNRTFRAPVSVSTTPLHEAARSCDPAVVEVLLDAGAKAVKDSRGHTPLEEAKRLRGSSHKVRCSDATVARMRKAGLR